MQAADFMSDVAGSDHAVLVLKDWRDRTQEDLLAEVADDLGFGEGSDEEEMTLNGLDAVPVSQGRAFFARLGLDTETDLVLAVEDWRDHTRDEMIDALIRGLDETIANESQESDEDDEALLEADIAQALYDSIDAQIEAKLAESQKLREEAEEMIDRMRATRGGAGEDEKEEIPARFVWKYPDFKTHVEFNAEMNKRWNRGDFSPFNW
jgi:hypothetical protein